MAGGTITIRRQIRSITNTKKVTKAMELVSAAKMRKAVATTINARPYAEVAREIFASLHANTDREVAHPLMTVRPVKTVAVITIGSNRGLCGGFNSQLAGAITRRLGVEYAGAEVKIVSLGRRLRDALARQGYEIAADFEKQDVTRSAAEIVPIVGFVVQEFLAERYDSVLLAYNHYVSAMKQDQMVVPLLPMVFPSRAESTDTTDVAVGGIFEPSTTQVLDHLIPRLLETQIFQAVIESEASEHSARMVAMKNATESAKDLLFDLQLAYNQIRQAAITQEIAEISAGRLAVE